MKKLLFVIFLFLIWDQSSYAQIFQTKDWIVQKFGPDFKEGIAEDGAKFMRYDFNKTTQSGGTFWATNNYYFKNYNGTELCAFVRIIEPVSETNYYVKKYKDNYVEISDMRWKDYAKNLIFSVEVIDNKYCVVCIWYDENKKN